MVVVPKIFIYCFLKIYNNEWNVKASNFWYSIHTVITSFYSFSTESFFVLFGIFLLIAVYEFCNLVQINKVFPIIFSAILFITITLISVYRKETEFFLNQNFKGNYNITVNLNNLNIVLLAITMVVSIKCILFLFYDSIQKVSTSSKYLYLLGYIILPFVFITKISFGVKDYNPKIIIGLFILIWTNDTFAYIVGKSIGKHKLLERISPKKPLKAFLEELFLPF